MAPLPARSDDIRRHNLALTLGEIHRDGALTRAGLTQRLGVSRSTVGALVADLIDLGLVEESVPTGGARVGRPSYVVGPHPDGPYVVAVDVDVPRLSVAAVGLGGTVLARRAVSDGAVLAQPASTVEAIAAALAEVDKDVGRTHTAIALGVSVPGTVDRRTKTVGVAPNLGWRNARLGALLEERLGYRLPVAIGNDADLSALAEFRRGNARGFDDVLYVIGRIGVGAGIIVNGSPLRGRDGRAGEIGHNVVDRDGPPCHCGKSGCLETFVGDAMLLTLAGRTGEPTREQVAAVFDDATAGDGVALTAVCTVGRVVGQALGELVNTFNPQRVILGGSLARVLELARAEVEDALDRYAFDAVRPVQLCAPHLGDDSALIGAAELAFTDLLANPIAAS